MTSNKLVNAYENYFLSIKNLPVELKENTIEFVFAYRKGIETVTLVTENPYIISKSFNLASCLPEEFYEKTKKYAIDIESASSNKVRVYKTLNSQHEIGKGYYIVDNTVVETKIYKKTEQRGLILIDRYDAEGNIISKNEAEVRANADEWKGSLLVPSVAADNNFYVNYLKKQDKDQCYARVRPI